MIVGYWSNLTNLKFPMTFTLRFNGFGGSIHVSAFPGTPRDCHHFRGVVAHAGVWSAMGDRAKVTDVLF